MRLSPNPPYNDLWTTRDGHYTFAKQNQDGVMSLVRKKTDGTVCSVFEKVDFRAISDEVLMMEGDTSEFWGVGYGFGTIIKGKRIPAGDEDEGGIWNTAAVDTVEIAEHWLMQNFHQQDSAATFIDAPIKSCSESDPMLLSDTPVSSTEPRYKDIPIVEGGGKSLIGMTGEEAKAAIEAINPSLHVILCPKQNYQCVTRDLRDDRVRIFVDKHGEVRREPKRG
jgi:hypothetical protein